MDALRSHTPAPLERGAGPLMFAAGREQGRLDSLAAAQRTRRGAWLTALAAAAIGLVVGRQLPDQGVPLGADSPSVVERSDGRAAAERPPQVEHAPDIEQAGEWLRRKHAERLDGYLAQRRMALEDGVDSLPIGRLQLTAATGPGPRLRSVE